MHRLTWIKRGCGGASRLARGDEEFPVAVAALDGRRRKSENPPTRLHEERGDVVAGVTVQRFITDNAPLPKASRPTSNCGLISAIRSVPGFARASAGGSATFNEMKLRSLTMSAQSVGQSSP